MPHLTVLTVDPFSGEEENICCIFDINFTEAGEKRAALAKIAREIYDRKHVPLVAVLSSEAWLAPEAGNLMPSQSPRRDEVIIVSALTIQRKCKFTFSRVSRLRGNIVCGAFEEHSEGAEAPILERFYLDYFQPIQGKVVERN